MFNQRVIATASLLLSVFVFPCAASITLPVPINGVTAIQYGDFFSYSMAFLNAQAGFGAPNGSDPFNVDSTPGAISDTIVVLTGSSGGGVNDNTSPGGLQSDNSFVAPSGVGDPSYFQTGLSVSSTGLEFSSGSVPNTNNGSPVDNASRFEVSTAALRAVAGTDNAIAFFFNLNEVNSTPTSLDGQDLLAWAQVDIVDIQGVLPTMSYFLTSSIGASAPDVDGPNGIGPGVGDGTTDPAWVYVNGIITVDSAGNLLHVGPKTGSDPATASEINQNLGANNAAFAIFNQELSDKILLNTGYDYISGDIRLSRLSNGFEQIFIDGVNGPRTTPQVPEPGMFAIWGLLGIVGAICIRRR